MKPKCFAIRRKPFLRLFIFSHAPRKWRRISCCAWKMDPWRLVEWWTNFLMATLYPTLCSWNVYRAISSLRGNQSHSSNVIKTSSRPKWKLYNDKCSSWIRQNRWKKGEKLRQFKHEIGRLPTKLIGKSNSIDYRGTQKEPIVNQKFMVVSTPNDVIDPIFYTFFTFLFNRSSEETELSS